MSIYRDKEDGSLTLGYAHMNHDHYESMNPSDVLKAIDEAPTWDWYDHAIWENLENDLEISADDYDDGESLFAALTEAAEHTLIKSLTGLGDEDLENWHTWYAVRYNDDWSADFGTRDALKAIRMAKAENYGNHEIAVIDTLNDNYCLAEFSADDAECE